MSRSMVEVRKLDAAGADIRYFQMGDYQMQVGLVNAIEIYRRVRVHSPPGNFEI